MSSRSRWIALVPLARPEKPDAEALLAGLARQRSDTHPPRLTSETTGSLTITFQGDDEQEVTANLTLVDRPIPWEQLEGPCATAWHWPQAEATLRPHTAHLFVTLLDESTKPIHQAMRLTQILVASAEAGSALGIVWGASGAVHEPTAFAQLAATTAPDNLPLNLWVDFRLYEKECTSRFGLFTTGLASLGYREFEVPDYTGDPQQLVAGVYNVAHYLLEKNAKLKPGEAIGLPNEQEVTIDEGPSGIDPEQPVWQLEFRKEV